ncbi:NADH-dependent phenylglyoxylate dehydrogenase subunit epsilon [Thauera aromatica]|uniref:NADH-dependent phenylglyoxylate dehydrogenase epsilon subunit PadH n=1 Tax=Thauera aromatica K172 TaxID=44139 RepID=A0A2R4BLL3_THAAR|nr:FAD-dependent oxidoreductase [Thauera aromatica]AVR88219.1 NADH-dependent phenylglyoxylate dehydrogenase epsilon subunit PadH [Thauera aromatica K172]
MHTTDYLIAGSSHAALEAINAIRMHDAAGSITVITRDPHPPYSPTVLPYVVSGRSAPERVYLRDAGFFTRNQVDYRAASALAAIDAERHVATLADGSEIGYRKLLLATGASPIVPPIPGIDTVEYHVLRTLDDATRLRQAMTGSRRAVVLGAGLVGMHAAENLVKAGAEVTIVEMNAQLTSGYFDDTAAGLIEEAFLDNGATIRTNSRVVGVQKTDTGVRLLLEGGDGIDADLLLVAVGVRPQLDYLDGSGVATERGILVDDAMRTNVADVWAAGDCAQARGFFSDAPIMNAILPDASIQGRIAGMGMAGDPGAKPYQGGLALNTYHFFGRHAISVGNSQVPEGGDAQVRFDQDSGRYLRVVFDRDNRLTGIFGVNEFFDAGVMAQLILRKTDLGPVRDRFMAEPLATGRALMSNLWR